MNYSAIIKAAIPEANESIVDYVMWERTPWPIGSVTAKQLYKIAGRLKRAADKGVRLCDFCDNKTTDDKYTCSKCISALSKPSES